MSVTQSEATKYLASAVKIPSQTTDLLCEAKNQAKEFESLLTHTALGNREAFQQLYKDTSPRVYAV